MGSNCFHHNTIISSTNCTKSKEIKDNLLKNSNIMINASNSSFHPVINVFNNEIFEARQSNKKKKILQEKPSLTDNYEKLEIKQKHNPQCEDKSMIEQCLSKHFFMRCLEAQARLEIIKEMSLAFIPPDSIIFKEGMPGSYFYILKTGSCHLIINNKKTKTFTLGESFGELALLHGSPRSGTVITETACYLWVLHRKVFKKIVDHITKTNFEENKNFIQSIPILVNIDHYQKAILCDSLYKQTFEADTYIVKEGDQPNCIFIVQSGEVNIIHRKNIIRTLRKGDYFGERSILVDTTRTMDVITKTNCVCYSISVTTLKNILGEEYRSLLYLNFIKSSFAMSKHFNRLCAYLIDDFFECFKPINLKKDQIAFEAGYIKSSHIVVIIDGHLINSTTKKTIANRGSILFEHDLIHNSQEKIDYNLIPYPDCLLISAKTSDVLSKLKESLLETIEKSDIVNSLSKINIFKNLPLKKLEIISQKISIETYLNNESIIEEGEIGNKFYIVKKGKVEITVNNKYLRTLSEKEYFGERALFFNENRSATAKAKGLVEVFYIKREDFMINIETNMKEHLMNRLYLQDNTVELNDLDYVKQLGNGNYGSVSLVQCRKNKFNYAIKSISRKQIESEQLYPNIELEKTIQLQIDHPFIVKLVKSLKDDRYIYFLMEYIRGKELFDIIRDIGLLDKKQTQFFGASMMLAIEYLHERKFIYRDLKPENIIVLSNGYLKIIDFGTAKIIIDRTSTIIGTPSYMAPEVVLGEGYSFQIDCWSIAICLYEFICGGVPFGEAATDPMDVYIAIINQKLTFPQFLHDKEFKQLMNQMLCKSPTNRLTKINKMKNHPWFNNFNWEELMSLNMIPPYIPKIRNEPCQESEKLISFIDYIKQNYKEWNSTQKVIYSNEQAQRIEQWYNGF